MNAEERERKSLGLVRKFALASVGVGVVAGPVFDFVALTALLVLMIEKIAGIYGRPFYPSLAKSLVAGLLAAGVHNVVAFGMLASLLKFLPVVGWGPLLLVSPAACFALTTAVGSLFVMHFESGGTLLDFNVDRMHEEFGRRFREGMAGAEGSPASSDEPAVVQDADSAPRVSSEETILESEEESAVEPAEATVDEPAGETADKPAEETADEPAEESADEPAEETADEPAEETADEPAEETADEPAEETVDEPAEESAVAPTEEATEEPAEESAEESAEEASVPATWEIKDLVVKAYRQTSYGEICAGPTDAVYGVSDRDAQILREVFAVHTVAEFASFSWTEVAETLCEAVAHADDPSLPDNTLNARYLDADFEATPLQALPNCPVTALKGIGEKRAQALDESFRVKTIGKLAQLKFVHMARTLVSRC
ncbi:hypothetical protein [Acanthopleuribacter pedis]|uniref:Uncharacterized protein n=1 Tax=Acanthopleuribacter pedis TaxID=442870 RepID=A0A8J7QD39_9BACT|nr:hypothetical protein [Acanthopleuribacter pedis]MBO1318806.1 hypothetical protein [Acanthopleuribacter pedis]